MITVEQLGADVVVFLHHLLSPENLSIVLTLSGLGWKLLQIIKKMNDEEKKQMLDKISNQQELEELSKQRMIDKINERLDTVSKENSNAYRDMQKEILRLQILEGIDVKRLSQSEVQYFYDKYKSFGGNSFVTEKVHSYLRELEEDNDDN